MRRWLLMALLAIAWPASLAMGQDTVVLRNGKVLPGKVLSVGTDHVWMEIADVRISVPRKNIADITMGEASAGEVIAFGIQRVEPEVEVEPIRRPEDDVLYDTALDTGILDESEGEGSSQSNAGTLSAGSIQSKDRSEPIPLSEDPLQAVIQLWNESVMDQVDRLVPEPYRSPVTRATFVLLFLSALVGATYVSCRISGFERYSFGRIVGFTATVVILTAIQLAFAGRIGVPPWPCVIGVNLLLWFIAVRMFFQEKWFNGTVLLVSYLVVVLVALLWAETAFLIVQPGAAGASSA